VQSAAALFTRSLVPGFSEEAERLNLGGGDPLERFRVHFHRSMVRLGRPVLVVVDDLDRCQPEFIVELVRGMQTLFRSPRIVFLILGDRDWIERAFAERNKAMNGNDGAEQGFGARFVEKAIQLSFVLPAVSKDEQDDYVRGLLRQGAMGRSSLAGVPSDDLGKLRQSFERATEASKGAVAPEAVKAAVVNDLGGAAFIDQTALTRFVGEELAIQAASNERTEQDVKHRLEPLAECFPSNPRQVKRIINAVTIYHLVEQARGLPADDPRWLRLARWIILMTEWPSSWRLLASRPEFADLLDKRAAGAADESTKAILDRLRADKKLMTLLRGGKHLGPRIDKAAIEDLILLTPVVGAS
jgi:hypothetical protein